MFRPRRRRRRRGRPHVPGSSRLELRDLLRRRQRAPQLRGRIQQRRHELLVHRGIRKRIRSGAVSVPGGVRDKGVETDTRRRVPGARAVRGRRPGCDVIHLVRAHGRRTAVPGHTFDQKVLVRGRVPDVRPRRDAPERGPGVVRRKHGLALPHAPLLSVHAHHRLDPPFVRGALRGFLEHLRSQKLAPRARRGRLRQGLLHVRRVRGHGVARVFRDQSQHALELQQTTSG
mmetsp:Transcript_6456/g.27525  ORF Transcript_6456/g.27525 Transcript_6456/m.27525 type:complete len:230 (-) Transcript_6456:529-1218(-)